MLARRNSMPSSQPGGPSRFPDGRDNSPPSFADNHGAPRVASARLATQSVIVRSALFSRSIDMNRTAPTAALTDFAVVSRLMAGDDRALGILFDRYGAMAFALASAMVADAADAEEVVADAFSQIWRSSSTFDAGRGSVVAWISTIVRTRALDMLRSRRRRARVLEEAASMTEDGASPALSVGAPSPDRGVEILEAQVHVRRALHDLPPPQRLVLELAYFGGLSQSEIADRLSEPLGTVKTRMRAGMEKLRVALKPLMDVSS